MQRAIAESRGQPPDRALNLESKASIIEAGYHSDDSGGENKESSGGRGTPVAPAIGGSTTGTKRKYRRHPKADEHAPERPPSAYVIFSNRKCCTWLYFLSLTLRKEVREELRGQDLSFTEMAKLVGERWQVLAPEIRETCERQAAAAKEKYYAEMAEYKKTPQYAQYQEYLAEFKAKHAGPRVDGKRLRVEHETSVDTNVSTGSSSRDRPSDRPSGSGLSESSLRHLRSHSNPQSVNTALGSLSGYRVPSASTSPATYSVGLQSPITQHAYSPGSSPPGATSVYSSYDLPHHHIRASQAAVNTGADSRLRDPGSAGPPPPSRYWTTQAEDSSTSQSPLLSDYLSRRPARPSSSLPPLVHADTTYSSHSDTLPGIPYQGSLLPVMDAPKGERMLPQPIPSAAGFVTSPLDPRPQLPAPAIPVTHVSNHDSRGSTWPALLQATNLARDADFQEAAAKKEDITP